MNRTVVPPVAPDRDLGRIGREDRPPGGGQGRDPGVESIGDPGGGCQGLRQET